MYEERVLSPNSMRQDDASCNVCKVMLGQVLPHHGLHAGPNILHKPFMHTVAPRHKESHVIGTYTIIREAGKPWHCTPNANTRWAATGMRASHCGG